MREWLWYKRWKLLLALLFSQAVGLFACWLLGYPLLAAPIAAISPFGLFAAFVGYLIGPAEPEY